MTTDTAMGTREGSLWMGDIHDYMHEDFIKSAFKAMDEDVHYVKLIRNKYTGLCAGYCFVHFKDEQTALRVMHKLNGKMIPHTHPPVRFMLNHSNANKNNQEREFSLWVGDLDLSVDDSQLYKAFATRYNTVRAARVVYDKATNSSRGYAFVRFGSEDEHKDALTHMNGFKGLANKPIRVSLAIPRKVVGTTSNAGANAIAAATQQHGGGSDYNSYYEQYWYNYQAWQNYAAYNPSAYHAEHGVSGVPGEGGSDEEPDDRDVVEHDVPVDVERMNRDCVQRSEEFWDSLDASRWLQPDTLNMELGLAIQT